MGSVFRSISVTVVDFLGTFIPGMAWVILLWEILYRFQPESCPKGFSLDIIIYPNNSPGISLAAIYFTFITLSIVVGYVVKSLDLDLAEHIAAFASCFYCFFNTLTFNIFDLDDRFEVKRCCGGSRKDGKKYYLKFPYNKNHQYQKYFLTVNDLVKSVTSIKTGKLPGKKLF